MVLVKRTKTWANSRSATVDDEPSDHSEGASSGMRLIKEEVNTLQKADEVCKYGSLFAQSSDSNLFADQAVPIYHWKDSVCPRNPSYVPT